MSPTMKLQSGAIAAQRARPHVKGRKMRVRPEQLLCRVLNSLSVEHRAAIAQTLR